MESLRRVVTVLTSPGRTFRAIAERPTWVAPLAVLLLLGGTVSALAAYKIDAASQEELIREQLEGRADALVVPIQAVVERETQEGDEEGDERAGEADGDTVDAVYVVEDGVARRRRVETGLSDLTHVELLSGVETGEPVVTGPFRALRGLEAGDPVRVEDPERDGDRDDDEEEP